MQHSASGGGTSALQQPAVLTQVHVGSGLAQHEDGRRKEVVDSAHVADDSGGAGGGSASGSLANGSGVGGGGSRLQPHSLLTSAVLLPVTAVSFSPPNSLPSLPAGVGAPLSFSPSQPSTPRVAAPPPAHPLASSSSSNAVSSPATTALPSVGAAPSALSLSSATAPLTLPLLPHAAYANGPLLSAPVLPSASTSGAVAGSALSAVSASGGSSSGALDSLLDGVSGSSDEDSQLRMIEEEDEDEEEELAHRRALASGRPVRRRPLLNDAVAADSEHFGRWSQHSPLPHPAHYPALQYPFAPQPIYPYYHAAQHPYTASSDPYYSQSLHSAHLAPYQRYPYQPQPVDAHAAALSASLSTQPPGAAAAATAGSLGVSASHWSSAPSSSASSLFSAPITLRGVRTFVFVSVVLNVGCLLVRDASLHSFALFLLLANTVAALCIITGRPFSLAVLLQARQPAARAQTQQAAEATGASKQQAGGSSVQPTSSNSQPVSTSAQPRSAVSAVSPASESSVVRAVSPAKSASAVPVPIPLSSPSSGRAQAAGGASQSGVSQAAQPVAASPLEHPLLSPKTSDSASAPTAAAAPQYATDATLPTAAESSAPSSASTSPTASRSPSPVPITAASVSVPAPFPPSSSAPQFDSGPWVVAPLPLFVRGFVHKLVAGCSTHYSEKAELASWCRTAGESFQVRIGPNYKRTKAKSASAPSLYECVGVDILQAESKIDHIARCIKLPLPQERLVRRDLSSQRVEQRRKAAAALLAASAASQASVGAGADGSPVVDPQLAALMAEQPDGDFEDEFEYVAGPDDAAIGVPPLWVVNFQIPAYPPPMPMWGKKEDGEGYSVVLYYALTEQAKDDLRHNATPAAKLLKAFVRDCGDEKLHGRYKSIPKIMNPDDCEVGRTVRSLIQSYNAKPFLTGPWCHAFIKGPGYVEVDIDVHRFRFVARKGAHSFLESLKSMVIDIAFVVEGQDDSELPEQIQAATRLHFPSPQDARNIQHFLRLHNQK